MKKPPSLEQGLAFPKPSKAARKKERAAKIGRRIAKMGTLRVLVIARSKGLCEACGSKLQWDGVEVDHWLGGHGRRRRSETIQLLWALCVPCHAKRHANNPSAEAWNDLFLRHCTKHGYEFVPHNTRG